MNSHLPKICASATLMLFGIFNASAASAGTLFRSYLSVNGVDTNPCTLQQPCRLLPAALAATASGGEVWMLDSANYNTGTVTITQSVTILAVPGALGSLLAPGTTNGDALQIPTANIKVTLRNLMIRSLISGTYSGVYVSGANAQLVVENSEFNANDNAIFAIASGVQVSVTHSIFRGMNTYAVLVQGDSTAQGTGFVDHCLMTGSYGGVSGKFSNVIVSHSSIANNSFGVVANTSSVLLLDDDVIAQNATGVLLSTGAIVNSAGNNKVAFNLDNIDGGSLTPATHQ